MYLSTVAALTPRLLVLGCVLRIVCGFAQRSGFCFLQRDSTHGEIHLCSLGCPAIPVREPNTAIHQGIIHSADLVTRTRSNIGLLLISIAMPQRDLESSTLLLRNGTASDEPGTH